MTKVQLQRVIISGGGTGGHIFPAIAIADALKEANPLIEILFVGANGRMEMEKVPAAGYKIEGLKDYFRLENINLFLSMKFRIGLDNKSKILLNY